MVYKCGYLLSQVASSLPERLHKVSNTKVSWSFTCWVSCFVACACWTVQPGLPSDPKG